MASATSEQGESYGRKLSVVADSFLAMESKADVIGDVEGHLAGRAVRCLGSNSNDVAGDVAALDMLASLDAVDAFHDARVEAEAALFELAAHFADLHAGEGLPRDRAVLPGRERAVRIGGEGTPWIAEFACAELGARMGMGSWAARRYVADALDVRQRLPLIWARLVARQARVGSARLVAARTRHLSLAAATFVDAAMVDFVDGSLPWGRFQARLDGKVVAADPEVAAAREAARVSEQFAKRTRSAEDGTAGFYVRSSLGVIARIDASVALVAEALATLGDTDDLDQRRVKAMVVLCNPTKAVELLATFAAARSRTPQPDSTPDSTLEDSSEEPAEGSDAAPADEPGSGPGDALDRVAAFARKVGFNPTRLPDWLTVNPNCRLSAGSDGAGAGWGFRFDWSGLLPPVTLNVHVSQEDLVHGRGGVARWEGEGPITHQFVHDYLRPLHQYRIQPVIDLANQAPVDAYEIPDRHRKAVRLRTPADMFPYSSDLTGKVDVEHTRRYRPVPIGAAEKHWTSRLENYGPLGRFHHRIKTHGHWVVRQPFAGLYLWRDPHGQIYLTDCTGTHRIRTDHPAGPARTHDDDLELYPSAVIIEADFADAS